MRKISPWREERVDVAEAASPSCCSRQRPIVWRSHGRWRVIAATSASSLVVAGVRTTSPSSGLSLSRDDERDRLEGGMRRDFTAESELVTSGQEFHSREREEGYRSEEGLALIPPC
jgi:hypothetical protein